MDGDWGEGSLVIYCGRCLTKALESTLPVHGGWLAWGGGGGGWREDMWGVVSHFVWEVSEKGIWAHTASTWKVTVGMDGGEGGTKGGHGRGC